MTVLLEGRAAQKWVWLFLLHGAPGEAPASRQFIQLSACSHTDSECIPALGLWLHTGCFSHLLLIVEISGLFPVLHWLKRLLFLPWTPEHREKIWAFPHQQSSSKSIRFPGGFSLAFFFFPANFSLQFQLHLLSYFDSDQSYSLIFFPYIISIPGVPLTHVSAAEQPGLGGLL